MQTKILELKIKQQIFHYEPIKGFKDIQIATEKRKFRIFFQTIDNSGYVEFRNCIIGVWEYLKNQKYYDEKCEWYGSKEECEAVILKQSPNKIKRRFERRISREMIVYKNSSSKKLLAQ